MPTERVFLYWGLVPLLVPLLTSGLGGGRSAVDRFFFAACAPLTFLLLGFFPRGGLPLAVLVAATLAFSTAVAALYLRLSPEARPVAARLLVVLGLVDASALTAVHLSQRAALGFAALAGLLLATTGLIGGVAVWLLRRRHAVSR